MKIHKSDIINYINENLEEDKVSDLEKSSIFMSSIIKYTKNFIYYERCNEKIKIDYLIIKTLLETFTENKNLHLKILEIVESYLEYNQKVYESKSLEERKRDYSVIKEFDIIAFIYLNKKYGTTQVISNKIILLTMFETQLRKDIDNKEGLGFNHFKIVFKDYLYIINFFKESFLRQIFNDTQDNLFSEFLLLNYKDVDKLKEENRNKLFFNYLNTIDEYLAASILEGNIRDNTCNDKLNYMIDFIDNRENSLYISILKLIFSFKNNNSKLKFSKFEIVVYIAKKYNLPNLINLYLLSDDEDYLYTMQITDEEFDSYTKNLDFGTKYKLNELENKIKEKLINIEDKLTKNTKSV